MQTIFDSTPFSRTGRMSSTDVLHALGDLTNGVPVDLEEIVDENDDDDDPNKTEWHRGTPTTEVDGPQMTSCEECVQFYVVPVLTCRCDKIDNRHTNCCHDKENCAECFIDFCRELLGGFYNFFAGCWQSAVTSWRSFDAKLVWSACQKTRTKWPGSTLGLVVALLILACIALFSRAPTVGGNEEASKELTRVIVWVGVLIFVASAMMSCFLYFCCYEYSSTFSGTDNSKFDGPTEFDRDRDRLHGD